MASEIKVDTISEKTSAGGVTIDSVKLKDGGIVVSDAANIGSASDTDAIAIASNGVVTFSQNPVFPDGGVAVADLDIDGATDIGAAIVDADLFIVDDGAGGTNRKVTASRLKTYAKGGLELQVITSANTTADTNSTTSFADSGNSVDITPSTNTNKILVHLSIPINIYRSSGTSARYGWKVLRDSTIIASGVTLTNYGYVGSSVEKEMGFIWSYSVYDEPDSTSAQTYKVQFANNEAGNLVAQPSSNTSCITAMEIEST